jgi:hypothetical protein
VNARPTRSPLRSVAVGVVATAFVAGAAAGTSAEVVDDTSAATGAAKIMKPVFTDEIAHDVSAPLSVMARQPSRHVIASVRVRPERGAPGASAATQAAGSRDALSQEPVGAQAIAGPLANFEGLSNQDNFNVFGGRVNPPDPVGDVGPNHYVEMVNLVFAVFDKSGTPLIPATDTGTLWQGFAVEDCTDPSGDPIVVYDQLADRWILSQFTTRGLDDPSLPFYNCVAVSTTGDPTGTYHRYAFSTGANFPDYPKYGVWTDSYVITTREFGPTVEYGIGVYALDKNKMLNGQPARAVSFFVDGNDPALLPLVGDGLLPADIDGNTKPAPGTAIPIFGTQDDGGGYGGTFDALNVWDLKVKWRSTPLASLALKTQLAVAPFDSIFPCAPTARDCLPQPGITDPNQYLDILSYRQRPTWRLAYRAFKGHESLVTSQSVEARPGQAGMRWYEVRRNAAGSYAVHQQGTYAPADGVHRWMGSIAQDKSGNMALGYSVVNGTDVYPGIRYTGRQVADPAGVMGLGEGTIVDGTGVQLTTNSRWGDYSSMNVDPSDDCTFWYVNEYYTLAGQASSPAGWQTRIASFKLPGCA